MNKDRLEQIGLYTIWGLIQGDFTYADLLTAFDGKAELWDYYPEPDRAIVRYLCKHGRVTDIPAFFEAIGEDGEARVRFVNSRVWDSDPITPGVLLDWAATLEQERVRQDALDVLDRARLALEVGEALPSDVVAQTGSRLKSLASVSASDAPMDSVEAAAAAEDFFDRMIGLSDEDAYVETGFACVDDNYGGAKRGGKTIIAGLPGSLKTGIVDQMTTHMAQNGQRVLWFCELSEADMLFRTALRETRAATRKQYMELKERTRNLRRDLKVVPAEKRADVLKAIEFERQRILGQPSVQALKVKMRELRERPVHYKSGSGLTAVKAAAHMDTITAQYGEIDTVVFDHIQILETLKKVDQSMSVRQAYFEIKAHIQDQFPNTAIMCIQHLNKDIQRVYKKQVLPSQTDLAYGGTGEMDLAIVMLRYAQHIRQMNMEEELEKWADEGDPRYEDFYHQGCLYVVKARDGQDDMGYPMRYDGEYYFWKEA